MSHKKKKLEASLEQARFVSEESLRLYGESAALRICVQAMGPIGMVIDSILSVKGQNVSYERLLKLFLELEQQVKELDEKMINIEFVQSEEFYDLLLKISEFSIKTRHDEKRKLFAKILVHGCVTHDQKTNPEFYINVISELSIEEILATKKLYELKTSGEYQKIVESIKQEGQSGLTKHVLASCIPNISEDDFEFILLRLEKTGLIKEKQGMIFDYHGGDYELTETFKKMMKILESQSSNL